MFTRQALFLVLSVLLWPLGAMAQSVTDDLPPVIIEGDDPSSDPIQTQPQPLDNALADTVTSAMGGDLYTVADVSVDVTADTAAHARDKALMQAQRNAYSQLCTRLSRPDNSAKLNDDNIAPLVKSFEVQSERVSAVRYIGVYTIRFNPVAVQKKMSLTALPDAQPSTETKLVVPKGPASFLSVAVQANTLATWMQIKRRIESLPLVTKVDTLDVGRGLIHIDLSYLGSIDDLKNAAANKGLVLRQNSAGVFELYDGSMMR